MTDAKSFDFIHAIARARVYDVALETPLDRAAKLSERLGNAVWLKREDMQPVFSFKLRGAYNRIANLAPEERARGVICASAGNHAQGVALASRRLGIEAVIVMPETTPTIKVDAVRRLGARVVLAGDTYSDASETALRMAKDEKRVFVHPYDDPWVIAGQGTIGMEILRQTPEDPYAVFVPVGGGGLIAGIALWLKRFSPSTRIVGVEPADADAMTRSVEAGRRVRLDQVGIFADGVAVREVGELTFAIARELVDDWVRVDTDEICAAIKDVYEDTRTILEPAGALSVAGLKRYVRTQGIEGRLLVAIASGANMNFDRLRHVAERTEMGEGREILFAATIPERPGSFLAFCRIIGRRRITEFNYRISSRQEAHVFVGVEIERPEEGDAIIAALEGAGYPVIDLRGNELAKLHIRHMVGGRTELAPNEVAFRFEFPERPGALLEFLSKISGRWNISMFHYRNHGADFGRVFAGIEVPPEEREDLLMHLKALGYPFVEETSNPAYRLFLRGSRGCDAD
ncbi:MAG: threonine ammonia-lyase, biosynthetic [Zetaproteobacteria bacterium]|nr:MAG: threonine ammonia-lyase, biosynthetic [Zetaproteobacteria bacterium]